MMKILTLTDISLHFEKNIKYLKYPPQKWDLEQILKLIERDNYNQILFDYGETYCLIILDLFEQLEEYETCEEILKQILIHNEVTESSYKTKLQHND